MRTTEHMKTVECMDDPIPERFLMPPEDLAQRINTLTAGDVYSDYPKEMRMGLMEYDGLIEVQTLDEQPTS